MAEEQPEFVDTIQVGKRRSSLGALSKAKAVTKLKGMFESKGTAAPKQKDIGLLGKLGKPVSASHDLSSFTAASDTSMGTGAYHTISIPAPSDQHPATPTQPLFAVLHPQDASQPRSASPLHRNDSLADGTEMDTLPPKSPGSGNIFKRMGSGLKKALTMTPKSSSGKQKRSSFAGSDNDQLSPHPSGPLAFGHSNQPSSTDLNFRSDQLPPRSPAASMTHDCQTAQEEQDWEHSHDRSREGSVEVTPAIKAQRLPTTSHARPPLSPRVSPTPSASILEGVAARLSSQSPHVVASPRRAVDTSPDQTPRGAKPAAADQACDVSVRDGMPLGAEACAMDAEEGFAASLTASPNGDAATDSHHSGSPPMREVNFGEAAGCSEGGASAASQAAEDYAPTELVFPSLTVSQAEEPAGSPARLAPATEQQAELAAAGSPVAAVASPAAAAPSPLAAAQPLPEADVEMEVEAPAAEMPEPASAPAVEAALELPSELAAAVVQPLAEPEAAVEAPAAEAAAVDMDVGMEDAPAVALSSEEQPAELQPVAEALVPAALTITPAVLDVPAGPLSPAAAAAEVVTPVDTCPIAAPDASIIGLTPVQPEEPADAAASSTAALASAEEPVAAGPPEAEPEAAMPSELQAEAASVAAAAEPEGMEVDMANVTAVEPVAPEPLPAAGTASELPEPAAEPAVAEQLEPLASVGSAPASPTGAAAPDAAEVEAEPLCAAGSAAVEAEPVEADEMELDEPAGFRPAELETAATAEQAAEPAAESEATPLAEAAAEPVVERAESAAELQPAAAEPEATVVELSAEPAAEPATEAAAELAGMPTAVPQALSEPEPEPAVEPAAEAAVEPAAEQAVEPEAPAAAAVEPCAVAEEPPAPAAEEAAPAVPEPEAAVEEPVAAAAEEEPAAAASAEVPAEAEAEAGMDVDMADVEAFEFESLEESGSEAAASPQRPVAAPEAELQVSQPSASACEGVPSAEQPAEAPAAEPVEALTADVEVAAVTADIEVAAVTADMEVAAVTADIEVAAVTADAEVAAAEEPAALAEPALEAEVPAAEPVAPVGEPATAVMPAEQPAAEAVAELEPAWYEATESASSELPPPAAETELAEVAAAQPQAEEEPQLEVAADSAASAPVSASEDEDMMDVEAAPVAASPVQEPASSSSSAALPEPVAEAQASVEAVPCEPELPAPVSAEVEQAQQPEEAAAPSEAAAEVQPEVAEAQAAVEPEAALADSEPEAPAAEAPQTEALPSEAAAVESSEEPAAAEVEAEAEAEAPAELTSDLAALNQASEPLPEAAEAPAPEATLECPVATAASELEPITAPEAPAAETAEPQVEAQPEPVAEVEVEPPVATEAVLSAEAASEPQTEAAPEAQSEPTAAVPEPKPEAEPLQEEEAVAVLEEPSITFAAPVEDAMAISPMPARLSLRPPAVAEAVPAPSQEPAFGLSSSPAAVVSASASPAPVASASRGLGSPVLEGSPAPISPETAHVGVRAFQLDLDEVDEQDPHPLAELAAEDEQGPEQPAAEPQAEHALVSQPQQHEQEQFQVEEEAQQVLAEPIAQPAVDQDQTMEVDMVDLPAVEPEPQPEPQRQPAPEASVSSPVQLAASMSAWPAGLSVAVGSPASVAAPAAAAASAMDTDTPMDDSLEAMEATLGGGFGDLLNGDDDLLPELMPQAASSPVSASKPSAVLGSARKIAPDVTIQVQRESLDLFSLRQSCTNRVSDSLMAESLDSFESSGLAAKKSMCMKSGLLSAFVPMAPVTEAAEDDTNSQGGASSMATPAASRRELEDTAGSSSPGLSFAPLPSTGSPQGFPTPGLTPAHGTPTATAPAATPATRVPSRTGAHGHASGLKPGSGSKGPAATPSGGRPQTTPTALKAMAAANGGAAPKTGLGTARRPSPSPLSATGAKPTATAAVTPTGAGRGPSHGGGLSTPAASTSLKAAAAAQVTAAKGGLALSPLVGNTPPAMGVRTGYATRGAAAMTPVGSGIAVTPPAWPGAMPATLFDTPQVLKAAGLPLGGDTPFGDGDLDTMELPPDAIAEAIAMLGGPRGTPGVPAALRGTPGVAASRPVPQTAPFAGTPTQSVMEAHVNLLTSKLAEAEATINSLQESNTMLRDALSTLEFEKSMTNDLDMEREARQFLEQESASLKRDKTSLEAQLKAAQEELKRHEQAHAAATAALEAKEAAAARRDAELEVRSQQMKAEMDAARDQMAQADARVARAQAEAEALVAQFRQQAEAATAKCEEEVARRKELQGTLGLQAHQMMQMQAKKDEAEAKFNKAMEQLINAQTTHKKQLTEYEQKLQTASAQMAQFNDAKERYRQLKQAYTDSQAVAQKFEAHAQKLEVKVQESAHALSMAQTEKGELMRMCNELLTQLEAFKKR
ncbi:hypothetical protein HYH03_011446 [Edaphochlamys debaryana]|uniref:Uncharacterized protein n=1 Tax=Edaphochlamys debaryana TaxID=47281 RepID=A0A835XS17_9CHLO|nr:hypothetical protein HYH03_011446 [Edaphochlamys debaryana]|eukprot:KAG2490142.1 hypothetical protein HYH03_011446 [Edaphochlamys debaryana]